ncbi:MAG: Uma2 family endonuclease [Gammaproteobacteria bacterium]|nr:Uma2 family endonuclease [Gammaproteobacteria bacterium]
MDINIMNDDIFDFFATLPESKLELIDGRLIVGNGLMGSRLLLQCVLKGWGAAAAVSLADRKLFWEALRIVYPDAPISVANGGHEHEQAWAAQVNYVSEDLSAGGEGGENRHWRIRDLIRSQLHTAATKAKCGADLWRDFVMRLGNNGFTPDAFLARGAPLNRLFNWYLEGAADLVIEVTLPAHADQDRVEKRRYYEAGGVLEYWIVDPERKETEFLRLTDGRYQPQQAKDGRYQSPYIPELVFLPDKLWEPSSLQNSGFDLKIFEADYRKQGCVPPCEKGGLRRGNLPFAPRIGVESVPIRFEEFVSWCPDSKIEGSEDHLIIGGNTRRYLGLSLMTLGLAETVKLLHPQRWVEALIEAEYNEANDAARKAEWWKIARKAAALLHKKLGIKKLAVSGDLIRPQPLDFWSDIVLVGYDLSDETELEGNSELYEKFKNPKVYLFKAEEELSPRQEVKYIELSGSG